MVEDPYLVDSFADAFEAFIKDDVQDNLIVASQPLPPIIIPSSVPFKFPSLIKVCGIHNSKKFTLYPLLQRFKELWLDRQSKLDFLLQTLEIMGVLSKRLL